MLGEIEFTSMILDGLVKNMNDLWIELSKESNTTPLCRRLQHLDKHEVWLDTLNLHETSWMLFADKEDESVGWPGIN